jgi:hypothetical protein
MRFPGLPQCRFIVCGKTCAADAIVRFCEIQTWATKRGTGQNKGGKCWYTILPAIKQEKGAECNASYKIYMLNISSSNSENTQICGL